MTLGKASIISNEYVVRASLTTWAVGSNSLVRTVDEMTGLHANEKRSLTKRPIPGHETRNNEDFSRHIERLLETDLARVVGISTPENTSAKTRKFPPVSPRGVARSEHCEGRGNRPGP